jgi:hypothetical protein
LERRRHLYDLARAANPSPRFHRAAHCRAPARANLVNHLAKHSDEFRTRWAAHDVRHHYSGHKHYHHPLIGEIELMFEAMALGHDQALTLAVYPARPGSASESALRLLAQLDR